MHLLKQRVYATFLLTGYRAMKNLVISFQLCISILVNAAATSLIQHSCRGTREN